MELLHASDAEERQRRAAGALLAQGCTAGDRVAFALGSSADLICAVLGAERVGFIPVLLNATLTPAERDELADDASATVMIHPASSSRIGTTPLPPPPAAGPSAPSATSSASIPTSSSS